MGKRKINGFSSSTRFVMVPCLCRPIVARLCFVLILMRWTILCNPNPITTSMEAVNNQLILALMWQRPSHIFRNRGSEFKPKRVDLFSKTTHSFLWVPSLDEAPASRHKIWAVASGTAVWVLYFLYHLCRLMPWFKAPRAMQSGPKSPRNMV